MVVLDHIMILEWIHLRTENSFELFHLIPPNYFSSMPSIMKLLLNQFLLSHGICQPDQGYLDTVGIFQRHNMN